MKKIKWVGDNSVLWLDFKEFRDERGNVVDIPYKDKVITDNDRLLNYQHDFLVYNDTKAYALLWQDFRALCKRVIKKKASVSGLRFSSEELNWKADIACEYVLRRYKTWKTKKGEIYVVKNFISAAYFGALHALWSPCERDFFQEQIDKLRGKKI